MGTEMSLKELGSVGEFRLMNSIDAGNAAGVEETLLEAVKRFDTIILDMQDLEYISSAGLRAFKSAYTELRRKNGTFCAKNVGEPIADILKLTGFGRMFKYLSAEENGTMRSMTITAEIANLDAVNEFIFGQLAPYELPKSTLFQIRLAVEEIFVNISSYAYDPSVGPAEVSCEVLEDPLRVVIQFLDHGKPFDPLAQEDPDTSEEGLLAREGGLGILLVKESMDEVSYRYEGGANILTVIKKL